MLAAEAASLDGGGAVVRLAGLCANGLGAGRGAGECGAGCSVTPPCRLLYRIGRAAGAPRALAPDCPPSNLKVHVGPRGARVLAEAGRSGRGRRRRPACDCQPPALRRRRRCAPRNLVARSLVIARPTPPYPPTLSHLPPPTTRASTFNRNLTPSRSNPSSPARAGVAVAALLGCGACQERIFLACDDEPLSRAEVRARCAAMRAHRERELCYERAPASSSGRVAAFSARSCVVSLT